MPAIGEKINLRDTLLAGDVSLVTEEMETAIVREYTFEELLRQRSAKPEALGPFARLSLDELHRELDRYTKFLVSVDRGDYRLVIGFLGCCGQAKEPTVLFARPLESDSPDGPYSRRRGRGLKEVFWNEESLAA